MELRLFVNYKTVLHKTSSYSILWDAVYIAGCRYPSHPHT